MKTCISLLALTVINFFFYQNSMAQNDDTEYVIVEYMKVKPGMWEEYRECEKAWKLVHQYRANAGLITGWELEEVIYPNGTATEYDFLTITHFNNWKAIRSGGDWYNAAMKTLPADQREIAENANRYRDLVKSEIWTAADMVFGPGNSRATIVVENFMKIPPGGWSDWVEMETRFVKPVHEKSIAMGNRRGWLMGHMVLPRGDDYPYQASTVDFYDSWEDMDKSNQAAWDAVYPDMSDDHIGRRFNAARTLVKTEVRRLVDFVE